MAGSVDATAELKLVMIRIVDHACSLAPTVKPSIYVDDAASEDAGTAEQVEEHIVTWVDAFCAGVREDDMDISSTKCCCLASSRGLGTRIQTRLKACPGKWHVPHVSTAKSLGSDMSAGLQRTTALANSRLAVFVSRYRRWRALGAAGVDLGRLARTGGTAVITYGQAIMGVADTMLHKQRSAVAAQTAPGAGLHGQNLDVARMLLDGSHKGKADPAF